MNFKLYFILYADYRVPVFFQFFRSRPCSLSYSEVRPRLVLFSVKR